MDLFETNLNMDLQPCLKSDQQQNYLALVANS